jgi:hypothetical protein
MVGHVVYKYNYNSMLRMSTTITMSSFGANGRLGNQLFQLASMIGLAHKFYTKLELPTWPYAKYFNSAPAFDRLFTDSPAGGVEAKETTFGYVEDWPPMREHARIDVWGYLQSEKYWKPYEIFIRGALTFKHDFIQQVRTSLHFDDLKRPIALSVRRGDYVNNPNYHLLPIVGYYYTALETHFPDWRERDIVVFSDDIPYCRCHFSSFNNVHYSDNNSDIEDICALSQCDDFIIGNSTFSWWGAYLANRGKVVRPVHHFNGDLKVKCSTKDYYPTEWIPHDHLNADGTHRRIDLNDVTFTIPVAYDHEDRKENLELCLRVLHRYFDTRTIVMEQAAIDKPVKFNYLQKGLPGVPINKNTYNIYAHDAFHRTRMLNYMMNQAATPYVFNWDADVFIPPLQILQAVELLRHSCNFVFPYKGAFARMPRAQWFTTIRDYEDIGMVKTTVFNGMNTGDAVSVGGAFGFQKSTYAELGGENENFISYGPEDVERVLRIEKLGYIIERTSGPNMYHMNHWVGPNSDTSNPYFEANNDELAKIKKMDWTQLKEYINSWPWKTM